MREKNSNIIDGHYIYIENKNYLIEEVDFSYSCHTDTDVVSWKIELYFPRYTKKKKIHVGYFLISLLPENRETISDKT